MTIFTFFLVALCGLLTGLIAGWFFGKKSAAKDNTLKKDALTAVFQALAAEQLDKNSEKFVKLASEREKIVKLQLDNHKDALTNLLTPLSEKIKLIDKERIETFGKLKNELQRVSESNEKLRNETGNLVNALRRPQVRGRWGEITLRRVVELAGMTVHVDFDEQQSVSLEKGRIRPDMVVHLPQNREIIVDSKVALDAYLSAYDETNEVKREEHLIHHAKQMRTHVTNLSNKSYWEQFSEETEFVIMFVPNDAFLEAAFQYDAELMIYAMQKNIIIATPSTLMAILQTIEFGWRQTVIQDNAREISTIGKELYTRINVYISHLNNIRKNLSGLINSFNEAVGSIERKLIPQLRRFKELGADDGKEVGELTKIESQPRPKPEDEVADDN